MSFRSWHAKEAIRAQLDELMGKDRDKPLNEAVKQAHWSDPEVCKSFILKFCPNELFRNTKNDLGACTYNHEERFKVAFEADTDNDNQLVARVRYSNAMLRDLEMIASKLDKAIQRAQDRVTLPRAVLNSEQEARVKEIDSKIRDMQKEMEKLGEEGEVDKSMELMNQVTALTTEREAIQSGGGPSVPVPYGGDKLQTVCVICGAISQSTDNQSRLVAHLEGKQHQGFLKIRVAIDELRQFVSEAREKNPDILRAPMPSFAPATASSESGKVEKDNAAGDRTRGQTDRDRSPARSGSDRAASSGRERDRTPPRSSR